MARVTSPRPSSSSSVGSAADSPKKHFIRISAEKMRWYRAQQARGCEAAAARSSGAVLARRVRINLKRRDSS